jgi:hypothetical protein
MTFWRNDSVDSFDPDGSGARALESAVSGARSDTAHAMRTFLGLLSSQLDPAGNDKSMSPWAVQEVSSKAATLEVRFVMPKETKRIAGSVVGGGLGVWIESNGHLSAEFVLYYHRLVCTNGMTRKMEAAGRIDAANLREWSVRIERVLPSILAGTSTGFETLGRSALVRLGLLRPMVPVVLNHLQVPEPENRLILDAFSAEPGDTLFHFVNAFARAANLVMLEQGMDPELALRKRRQLQTGSWRVCEDVLAHFAEGTSLLDTVQNLRGIFSC